MSAATQTTNARWRFVEPHELYIELKGLYFSSLLRENYKKMNSFTSDRGCKIFSTTHSKQNVKGHDLKQTAFCEIQLRNLHSLHCRFLFILSNFLLNKSASTSQKYEAKFLCPDRKGIVSYFFNTTKTHETVHACCNLDWWATLYQKMI